MVMFTVRYSSKTGPVSTVLRLTGSGPISTELG
jgi:hypothetical protein